MPQALHPICVVDDDASIRESLEDLLQLEGYKVELFANAQKFTNRARQAPISCVILDIDLPGLSGLELQEELVHAGLELPIIFLTGKGSIPISVRAMKSGAVEFLTKPFDPDTLLAAIRQAIAGGGEDAPEVTQSVAGMVGESHAMKSLLGRIEMVAATDSTVLVYGETGVGKELIAQEVHERSHRAKKPLVKVNCASIPKDLYESEFFGHVKGAFTGAVKDRVGRFEAADGGTLFLDEVGEIPLELQSKLLRALQERSFERVGDERTRKSDVRIVAATNRDLKEEVAAGRFREDLYYRLNVFPLRVVPLRERRDDIAPLARHFIGQTVKAMKAKAPRLPPAALYQLEQHSWPGNIRELRNVIERAVIVAQGGALEFELAPSEAIPLPAVESKSEAGEERAFLTEPEMLQRERDNTLAVLEQAGWKVKGPDGAAELLGIKPTTLLARIKKMGLKRDSP